METISVAYILHKEGSILALKRSENKKSNPGKWHVLSGHVEEGETPLACIHREAQEELGTKFSMKVQSSTEYLDIQEDGQWKTHIFIMRCINDQIVLNDENSDYTWVSLNELLKLDIIPSIQEDLKHINI